MVLLHSPRPLKLKLWLWKGQLLGLQPPWAARVLRVPPECQALLLAHVQCTCVALETASQGSDFQGTDSTWPPALSIHPNTLAQPHAFSDVLQHAC